MQSQEFLTPLVETLQAQIGAEAVVSFFSIARSNLAGR